MIFLDDEWMDIGLREDLCNEIEKITGIETKLLPGESQLSEFSVAKRMSWASARQTTRMEDQAYCLMGIFDVNMPLLYGEGNKAFIRLQEEIMRDSDDETLFAWETDGVSEDNPCGILARSPKDFANSGDIFPMSISVNATPFASTNRGIMIQAPIISYGGYNPVLILQCSTGIGVVEVAVKARLGLATNNETEVVRVHKTLKRQIPLSLLLGNIIFLVYIPKTVVKVSRNDNVSSRESRNDASSTSKSREHNNDLRYKVQPQGHHKKLVISFDDIESLFIRKMGESNVARIHRMLEYRESDKVCFYRVWTRKTTLKGIFLEEYSFIMRHFNIGDQVFFFGYSKGALAAKVLANLVSFEGILPPENHNLISEVWNSLYGISTLWGPRNIEDERDTRNAFQECFMRGKSEVRFSGYFDATDSHLSNFRFKDLALASMMVRHAIAIDEQQVSLRPDIIENILSAENYDTYNTLYNLFGSDELEVGDEGLQEV